MLIKAAAIQAIATAQAGLDVLACTLMGSGLIVATDGLVGLIKKG